MNEKISDAEIEEFLSKLSFAVNLPDEVEHSELIKSELGQEFNNIDKKNVYSCFLEEVFD
ncbi:MAG: hypothetical protein PV340_04200 [Wolbachia sp.]|nr:hypothetical protein [Wolbachia sp.]MDD9336196.1 hypothetical protein [Wolbachia sp.]